MREIQAKDVTATVARLAKEANYYLGEDVSNALKRARDTEKSPVAKEVLDQILENARIAKELVIARPVSHPMVEVVSV